MPVDWETVRLARLASRSPTPSDWDQREKLIVDAARVEFAETRAREQDDAELAAAVTWAERKSAAASKAGDPDDTDLWTRAAATLRKGRWPVSRRVASSPDVVAHQHIRSELLYQGLSSRLDDQ